MVFAEAYMLGFMIESLIKNVDYLRGAVNLPSEAKGSRVVLPSC